MDSDLQSLEDSLCETVDPGIAMETAQSKLDQYQPLVSGLKESYPAVKELGLLDPLCVWYTNRISVNRYQKQCGLHGVIRGYCRV